MTTASARGNRGDLRPTQLAVAFLGPPVAWLLALTVAYLTEDLVCSAAREGHTSLSPTFVRVVAIVAVGAFGLATVAAGVLARGLWRGAASRDDDAGAFARFVGLVGTGLAGVFLLGILGFAVVPIVFEACA